MDKGDAASVNPGRTSHLPGCVSTGGSAGRRKSSSLRWCAADQGRPVRERERSERSWAGAARLAQPDTITARVGADESSPADQADRVDHVTRTAHAAEPPASQAAARLSSQGPRPLGPVRRSAVLAAAARDSLAAAIAQADTARAGARLAWTWIRSAYAQLKPESHERLADWTARCVQQLGDLVFAVEDQEAAWHAWDVEQRFAGLGRLYRDQRFDALVSCPRCHRVSTVTGSTVCKQCSATDRLVRT